MFSDGAAILRMRKFIILCCTVIHAHKLIVAVIVYSVFLKILFYLTLQYKLCDCSL